ncbi:MAG: hypothetical protein JOZ99_00075 [Actinobacteria bacterium]|nr:hypothetical protein [Actinomycetota bacterium]
MSGLSIGTGAHPLGPCPVCGHYFHGKHCPMPYCPCTHQAYRPITAHEFALLTLLGLSLGVIAHFVL